MDHRLRSARRSASRVFALVALAALAVGVARAGVPAYLFPEPDYSGLGDGPKHYVCCRASGPLTVDGRLDEGSWQLAAWTDEFTDIEGSLRPEPRLRTRAKMLWDDNCFYVAAEMEEPHVWATLEKRDSVIFRDNDFEVFMDPDGDTHEYYELEVNAFGTEWDLLLTRPYRDGGTAIDSWDIQGLRTGVHVRGTLNDTGDIDEGWTVELAIPWAVLEECAHRQTPPGDGDVWRVNFSRVEWRTDVVDGGYVKSTDPETGKTLYEDNWVWSPQGLINMHYPEMWGYVQFSSEQAGTADVASVPDDDYEPRRLLMNLYYRERTFHGNSGEYTDDLERLYRSGPEADRLPANWPPEVYVWPDGFEAVLEADNGRTIHVDHEGRLW